jgi:hypothetical protein
LHHNYLVYKKSEEKIYCNGLVTYEFVKCCYTLKIVITCPG